MILDTSPPLDQRLTCKRRRIVIVEDDPALLSALQFSLEAEGYDVCPFAAQTELIAERGAFLGASCLVLDYRHAPLDGLQLYALNGEAGKEGFYRDLARADVAVPAR